MDFTTPSGFLFCVILFPPVFLMIWIEQLKKKAKTSYYLALEQFKTDPTNTAKRKAVFDAGRNYLKLSRNRQGSDSIDELAILEAVNRISATTSASKPTRKETQLRTTAERLKELDELLNQDLISQDEYLDQRATILAEI